MMKAVLVVSCCAGGIALCIWGRSAFTALGTAVGISAAVSGVFFLYSFTVQKNCPLFLGLGLAAVGVLLIVLCLFIKEVPSFLGGIIFIGAGCAAVPFCRKKIVFVLAGGCVVFGVIFIVAPVFAAVAIRLAGVFLIVSSELLLVCLQ